MEFKNIELVEIEMLDPRIGTTPLSEEERMEWLDDYCVKNRIEIDWSGLITGTQKAANLFVLGAIIDYQMTADYIWKKATWLAEEHFKGTENVWKEIAKYSEIEWDNFCKENSVHKFPGAYRRIRRIGLVIADTYGGDARNIWRGVSNDKVRERLTDMRFGPQITNMVMGALFDCKVLVGKLDIKADSNVTRVLGRVIKGGIITSKQANELARLIHPENPWLIDFPIFDAGREFCHKNNPDCDNCPFNDFCKFLEEA